MKLNASNKKVKNFIGVYIDVNEIVVSVSSLNKDKINVSKIISVNTDYSFEGIIKPLSLNNDFFSEKQKWVVAFKEVIKKADLSDTQVIVSLSDKFSITRFFSMPYVDRKFWNKSIPIESKKYIPLSFDELSYDFYALSSENNSKISVCFSVTPKKTIEFFTQLLKQLNINLVMIEPSVISFFRFYEIMIHSNGDPVIIVHISNDDVYVLLGYQYLPVVFRSFSFKNPTFSQRQSLDLKGSMLFVQRIFPDVEFKKVILAGNNIDEYIPKIKSEIGLEPQVIDLSSKVNINSYNFSHISSISSSLKSQISEDVLIDLSGLEKSKKIEKMIKNFVFSVAGIISSFFILLFFIVSLKNYFITNKLTSILSNNPQLQEILSYTPEDIQMKINLMDEKNKFLIMIFDKNDFVAPKLSELSDVIPTRFWIKEMKYVNSISPNISESKINFIINGNSDLKGEPATRYFEYFKQELKKSNAFKICNFPAIMRDNISSDLDKNISTFEILCEISKDNL